MAREFSLAYYRFLEKVGGKGVALHIGGGSNTIPHVDDDFKKVFQLWYKERQVKGLVKKRQRKVK